MDKSLLTNLLSTVTVGGCEEPGQRVALDFAKDWAERQTVDAVGNAMSFYNQSAPVRVMLCGHIDEIGFRVTHITEDGLLRVQKAGGVRARRKRLTKPDQYDNIINSIFNLPYTIFLMHLIIHPCHYFF